MMINGLSKAVADIKAVHVLAWLLGPLLQVMEFLQSREWGLMILDGEFPMF